MPCPRPLPLTDRLRRGEVLLGRSTSPTATLPLGFVQSPAAAPPPDDPLFAPSESHLVTVAPTGAGKGRSVILPTLLTYPGTVVVIDPKGEALSVTRRHRETLGPVFVLDPFGVGDQPSDALNPFDGLRFVPGGVEAAAQEIKDTMIGSRTSHTRDEFWNDKAGALLAALIAYAIGTAPEGERHLGTVYEKLVCTDTVYTLAVLMDTVGKEMPASAHGEIASVLETTDTTRSGILSTAQRYVDILALPEVRDTLATTTVDLDGFVAGAPMTIYLVLPPTKLRSFGPLLRLWIGALLGAILHGREHRPEIATLLLIDEAAQLGTMDALRQAMTLYRYKGIRAWTFWQDLSQMSRLYPDDWETLLNNAGVMQTFGVSTYRMAKTLATVMHEEKIKPHHLLGLGAGEQMVLLPGGEVHVAEKLDYLTDAIYASLYDRNPIYSLPARSADIATEADDAEERERPVPSFRFDPDRILAEALAAETVAMSVVGEGEIDGPHADGTEADEPSVPPRENEPPTIEEDESERDADDEPPLRRAA